MAKIKLAAPLSGLRGTIGGVVYSANKSGPYAKPWMKPVNPRTPKQLIARGRLSQFPTLWAGISAAQRTAWDVFAALPAQERTDSLGQTYYASGYNWFVKINVQLDLAGHASRDNCPSLVRPGQPTVDDLIVYSAPDVGAEKTLLHFPIHQFTGYDAILFLAFRTAAGAVNTFRQYRNVFATVETSVYTVRFADEMAAAFGWPSVGWPAFLTGARQNAHGQRGLPATISTTVIAHP